MPEPSEKAKAVRRLGLFDCTMLVAGTMIGSGIVVTTASIARDVGGAGWLLTVWALAGVLTVLGALSFGELAGMMPHAGGQYAYLRESYGPLWAFLFGWANVLVIQTGSIAAVAVAFANFLGVLVPGLGTDDERNALFRLDGLDLSLRLPLASRPFFQRESFVLTTGQLVAVGVIALLTWVNCRGVREGRWVQNAFTVAKVAALGLLVLIGLGAASSARAWQLNAADWWGGIAHTDRAAEVARDFGAGGALLALMVAGGAMVGALFCADGWNNLTFTAGEVEEPRRTVPLGLGAGAAGVIALYLLVNVAYLAALPVQPTPELRDRLGAADEPARGRVMEDAGPFDRGIAQARDERVGSAVMEVWSPRLGGPLLAAAVLVSTFGCVNGMILMGARLSYAMAGDGVFFRWAGRLSGRGVPRGALVAQGVWSCALVFSGSYDDLLDFVIFAVLLFYALTVAALFVLRRTRPDAARPVRAFGYPVLPAAYVVCCVLLMADLLFVKPRYTWPGLLIIASGIPAYAAWRLASRGRKGAA